MPIYEYQCLSCYHGLEALQKISDEPLQKCPACGELGLKKKVSAAAFRLKGGGWYETDFKTGDKKNIAGDSSESGAAASSKESSPGGEKSTGKGDSGESGAGKKDSSKSSSGNSNSSNSSATA
jgi:putative FmdB family regulatory protein